MCQIFYNAEGKVINVLDEKGNSSELYKELLNVVDNDAEQALRLWAATYTEKFRSWYKQEGEPSIFYRGAVPYFSNGDELSPVVSGEENGLLQGLSTVMDKPSFAVVYKGEDLKATDLKRDEVTSKYVSPNKVEYDSVTGQVIPSMQEHPYDDTMTPGERAAERVWKTKSPQEKI